MRKGKGKDDQQQITAGEQQCTGEGNEYQITGGEDHLHRVCKCTFFVPEFADVVERL